MAYPKQPQNPFSARGQELAAVSPSGTSRRMITLFCSSLTFAFVILLFSSESMMAPEMSEAERRVGGLRSHFKFLPQVLVSLSPKESAAATDNNNNNKHNLRGDESSNSQEDDDDDEEEEEVVLDPEYQVTKNKRIGETKEKVKQEHQELHASVQNHVFGQENTENSKIKSVRRESFDEITPLVVTKVDSAAAAAAAVQKDKGGDADNDDDDKEEQQELAAILKNEPLVNVLSENEHSVPVEENSDNEEKAGLSTLLQNEPAGDVISEDQHSESSTVETKTDNEEEEVDLSTILAKEPVVDVQLDSDHSATT